MNSSATNSEERATSPRRMDIKEFREFGYLQELNRQFLHPLGLALEVVIDDDGNETLGGVWDYRDEDEGIHYDLKNSPDDRLNAFRERFFNVLNETVGREELRMRELGFFEEPIPEVHNG